MPAIAIRPYLSPTLVLLALDWEEGAQHPDFLGFAIKRTPGFRISDTSSQRAASSWLPNRLGFDGPPEAGAADFPSNQAPIQKFMWWDARLGDLDHGIEFIYEAWPVLGTPQSLRVNGNARGTVAIQLPRHDEHGIGTWFNRAVVSSQAFSRIVAALGLEPGAAPTPDQSLQLLTWLANGMERAVPEFVDVAQEIAGAIYHLTDRVWIIPRLATRSMNIPIDLVYDARPQKSGTHGELGTNPNQQVVDELGKRIRFNPRTHTNIMHNKFLVSGEGVTNSSPQHPERVLSGSANFTTEGITGQANLIHTFDSPALAASYAARQQLLRADPALSVTSANAEWSEAVKVGDATIRVFFPPEPANHRLSIDTIVEAIQAAASSVLFCLFDPTDKDLRDACFKAGDDGRMMFGLVNKVKTPKAGVPRLSGRTNWRRSSCITVRRRIAMLSAPNIFIQIQPRLDLFPSFGCSLAVNRPLTPRSSCTTNLSSLTLKPAIRSFILAPQT